MMTDFIQANNLLTSDEIEALRQAADVLDQPAAIKLQRFSETISWEELIDFFTADALDSGCSCTATFSFTHLPIQM